MFFSYGRFSAVDTLVGCSSCFCFVWSLSFSEQKTQTGLSSFQFPKKTMNKGAPAKNSALPLGMVKCPTCGTTMTKDVFKGVACCSGEACARYAHAVCRRCADASFSACSACYRQICPPCVESKETKRCSACKGAICGDCSRGWEYIPNCETCKKSFCARCWHLQDAQNCYAHSACGACLKAQPRLVCSCDKRPYLD
jgi:hypothetical protein